MATTDLDLVRVGAAKNQSVFRDVNERIEDIGEGVDMKLDLGRAMGATHNPLLFSSLL